ncbi:MULTISPECIES: DUF397 domain-containing protein [Nocardia]|uniref:DUF397 domain-containing protein n=1 Tax=Nocardia TaxID=1817 RepID=UPI0027E2828A|nr:MULTISPECIES: DUF397 domain-containing protein [Nocardia]
MTIDLSAARWFKSSRSAAGNNCVEVAFLSPDTTWFKSSRSGAGSDCVEVAHLPRDTVAVRDSKNPTGPVLLFNAAEWAAFTANLADGRFDHP